MCRVQKDDATEEGVEDPQIEDCIASMLQSAKHNGLPEEWFRKLTGLVRKYADVWRSELGKLGRNRRSCLLILRKWP
jgi:hypothetical protein